MRSKYFLLRQNFLILPRKLNILWLVLVISGSTLIINAFSPLTNTLRSSTRSFSDQSTPGHESSTIALFGVRSTIRRKVKSVFKKSKKSERETTVPALLPEPTVMIMGEGNTEHSSSSVESEAPHAIAIEQTYVEQRSNHSEPILAIVKQQPQLHLEVVIPETTSEALTRAMSAAKSDESLYKLPERNNDRLTKLEAEFRSMLEQFANYSEADILSIADPRKRALFEGIAASAHSQPVYRAFEVLFEDLYPLRMAGRVIYKRLQEFMKESVAQRAKDIQEVVTRTGLTEDVGQIEAIRLMFVTTASELNGDSYLTLEQLAETGIVSETATAVLGFDSSEKLLEQLDKDLDGKLTFTGLLNGMWELAETMCGIENCNPHAVLHNLLVELNENPPSDPTDPNARLDAKRRKFGARYDFMVSSFIEWEHLLPPKQGDESRRMDVVRGCFVGAENQKVVDALRIVYVDYAALRLAGDVIFKLVSSLLNRR